jgi:hypothetical protein
MSQRARTVSLPRHAEEEPIDGGVVVAAFTFIALPIVAAIVAFAYLVLR